jgi:hypothetical protein
MSYVVNYYVAPEVVFGVNTTNYERGSRCSQSGHIVY